MFLIFSGLSESKGQNTFINGFYGADFTTPSYTPIPPANFQTMEGSIDTSRTKGLNIVTKSIGIYGAESETASVLDENGQCVLFKNFEGVFKGSLFKLEKGKLILTRKTIDGGKIAIVNPVDMSIIGMDVTDIHDFDIATDTSFWVFQDQGSHLGVAVHQGISGTILEQQDTTDYYAGSYLPTHYWIDFMNAGIGEYVHPNGMASAFGILAVTARHQNQLSLHYNGMQLRLRPPGDPYNDFTWIESGQAELGIFGLHCPEIIGLNGTILTVTVWDNGNFRSWDGTYQMVIADIDDDGILDTVQVPTLTAASYSRGLELQIDLSNLTVEIVKEYLPNGHFYGGAMGSFELVDENLYSFNYGMADGEYPYSPFEAPEPSATLPTFGVATRQGNDIVFSGFYPDACVYQLQATYDTLTMVQPSITCAPVGSDLYQLTANDFSGEIQWSNGLTESSIIVHAPEANDFLFWETEQAYNKVSKKITPSFETCLVTSNAEALNTQTPKATAIDQYMLSSMLTNNKATLTNISGQLVNPNAVTTGYYFIGKSLYYVY